MATGIRSQSVVVPSIHSYSKIVRELPSFFDRSSHARYLALDYKYLVLVLAATRNMYKLNGLAQCAMTRSIQPVYIK